jgi:hypothetical protein
MLKNIEHKFVTVSPASVTPVTPTTVREGYRMNVPVNPPPSRVTSGGLPSVPSAPRRDSALRHVEITARALRAQAGHGFAEAQCEPDPAERFLTAYLAALRGAAALLALYGRPHRGRSRPTSAWALLTSAAPEFAEWAIFFAERSATRAAVAAGARNRVDHAVAADLVGKTGQFLVLVDEAVRSTARSGVTVTAPVR